MKLLIVDDEVEICESLKQYLESYLDWQGLTATTVGDALLRLGREQPEVMLLDVNLKSKRSGFDVLTKLKTISPATKAIMITGMSDFESFEKASELGAVDYVTK